MCRNPTAPGLASRGAAARSAALRISGIGLSDEWHSANLGYASVRTRVLRV